ncbi:hypothetical protein ACQPW3_21140 [Actinosynnema sp. CA-248983]
MRAGRNDHTTRHHWDTRAAASLWCDPHRWIPEAARWGRRWPSEEIWEAHLR